MSERICDFRFAICDWKTGTRTFLSAATLDPSLVCKPEHKGHTNQSKKHGDPLVK
jgi:hypothetical protein